MAKKKKRKFNKMIFMSILLLMGGYVLFTLYEQSKEMTYLENLKKEYEVQVSQTQEEINQINKDIENAHRDEYIEKVAREQLKMIGENEIIFVDLGKRDR